MDRRHGFLTVGLWVHKKMRILQQVHQNPPEEHAEALQWNYEMLNEVWVPMLESKTAQDLGAEPNLVRRLLDWFWTWQYPVHNFLYKPCFIMDMALGGPYYSKFLLHCILALSARHLDAESTDNEVAHKGEIFLVSAKELLMRELGASKPKITTVQGLLILGGRQCAVGQISEGWLYTGMAIRMLADLGLHLIFQGTTYNLERLTPIDLEVRKRLYCSAYAWDKTLSLSLGRPPALNRLPPAAFDFRDHVYDLCAWSPPEFPEYSWPQAHQTSCFTFFCRLGTIIEIIMLPLSNDASTSAFKERLTLIENKLRIWYDELPASLRMASDCEKCPPPNIFSLNILYHTLHIILWRPCLDIPDLAAHATASCIAKAQAVHDMFAVYGQTFCWQKVSYLVSYCVYTAATVYVHEMKSADVQRRQVAARRLASALQILEDESKQTPGIRRSIDIIKRQLRIWTPKSTANSILDRPFPHEVSNDASLPGNTVAQVGQDLPGLAPSIPDHDQVHEGVNSQSQHDHELENEFAFLDTSAGFYIPWSLDDPLNHGMNDPSLFGADVMV